MQKLLNLAKTLFVCGLMLSPSWAFGDAKTLSWQDLLPELDDTLDLNDGISWGERVRLDLNEEDVRIPGFIVPLEYKEQEIVTRFLWFRTSVPVITNHHRPQIKPYMQCSNPDTS